MNNNSETIIDKTVLYWASKELEAQHKELQARLQNGEKNIKVRIKEMFPGGPRTGDPITISSIEELNHLFES